MKLKIDEKEIAAILVDWAKAKYKTHNISVQYIKDYNRLFAEIEIMLSEDQFGDSASKLTEETIAKLHKVPSAQNLYNPEEDDLMPVFPDVTL